MGVDQLESLEGGHSCPSSFVESTGQSARPPDLRVISGAVTPRPLLRKFWRSCL